MIIFLSKYSQSVRIPAWIAYENMQALRRFIDGVDVGAQVMVCSSGMKENRKKAARLVIMQLATSIDTSQ